MPPTLEDEFYCIKVIDLVSFPGEAICQVVCQSKLIGGINFVGAALQECYPQLDFVVCSVKRYRNEDNSITYIEITSHVFTSTVDLAAIPVSGKVQ